MLKYKIWCKLRTWREKQKEKNNNKKIFFTGTIKRYVSGLFILFIFIWSDCCLKELLNAFLTAEDAEDAEKK